MGYKLDPHLSTMWEHTQDEISWQVCRVKRQCEVKILNRLERDCSYCGTKLYWNREDTTMKSTGSWYEDYLDILHDRDRCNEVRQKWMN